METMCKVNNIQSQESAGTWEIALDIPKSEGTDTNCVPAEVKATGF